MSESNKNNDNLLRDAQFRKSLSIAFFNATNSAISLVATTPEKSKTETLARVIEYRDFFLEEHKNYYATVIANVGANYKVEESIIKLKSTTSFNELEAVWRLLSEDERRDEEIIKVAKLQKDKYPK